MLAIGTGLVQIGAVVALAMAAPMLLGGTLLVTEAAVSGLCGHLGSYNAGPIAGPLLRRALVGSGVALGISALFPNDPRWMVEHAVHPILDELIIVIGETQRLRCTPTT